MSNNYDTLTGFMEQQEMLDVIKINQNTERGKRELGSKFFGEIVDEIDAPDEEFKKNNEETLRKNKHNPMENLIDKFNQN